MFTYAEEERESVCESNTERREMGSVLFCSVFCGLLA